MSNSNILDGKRLALQLQNKIRQYIIKQQQQGRRAPRLDVILVGNDPASEIYVKHKKNACKHVGMDSHVHHLDKQVSQQQLEDLICQLNANSTTDGILVQLPLPQQLDVTLILEKIDPKKDVDGFHPYNLGRLAQGMPLLRPCTPAGIIKLIQSTKTDLTGKHAVIVGTSNIVGLPMILELRMYNATITVCNKSTVALPEKVALADVLVVATGNPHLIQGEWLKPGSIVIDVGMNRTPEGKLVGDVDFAAARKVAGWITPVPGGVGPMTVAMLLENTLSAYSNI